MRPLTRSEKHEAAAWVWRRRRELAWLHDRLADDASRSTLTDLLAHRLAGSARVVLGVDRAEAEGFTRFAQTVLTADDTGREGVLYDLAALGLDVRLRTMPLFVIHTFLLEQYRHPAAAVRPGDRVVDGGAFWGGTALAGTTSSSWRAGWRRSFRTTGLRSVIGRCTSSTPCCSPGPRDGGVWRLIMGATS